MTARATALPGAAAITAAALVALALALLLAQPSPAQGGGCGEVERATARKDVNPNGFEPYAFGDSVMHPAKFELADRGFNTNSRGCRSFDDGVAMMRHLKQKDKLPHLMVMALGTDGRVTPEAIQEALDVLGPTRVLGLVTPREAGGGANFDAVTMRQAARENPRQIVLLDWIKYSRGHDGWFQPDGTHLTIPRGSRAFAAFLAKAIRFSREGTFSNGAVFPVGGEPPPPVNPGGRPRGKCAGRPATLSGTRLPERLVGTPRRDVIVAFGGGDEIFGNGGNDLICGGGGTDSLEGGEGADDLHGGDARDALFGGDGKDILRGQKHADYLMGGAQGDEIVGGPAGSTPRTGDIAGFTGRTAVRVSLQTGNAYGHGSDELRDVEGILGSYVRDIIYGDENPNSLSGAASRDLIVAGSGNDLIGAGPADDTVYGGAGADTIFGASGHDELFGDGGADRIEGYQGDDYLDGGPGGDPLLAGQNGDDIVFGAAGDDILFGDYEPCADPGCQNDFGDDVLDGGSDGETAGDQGDGGPHPVADSCVNLETQTECESLGAPLEPRRRFARPTTRVDE